MPCVVLPYDPERDAVVMIEQFRIGAAAGGMPMWQLEVIAGIIDEGETPEAVAHREAQEEARCEILDLVPVYHYLASSGGTSETRAAVLRARRQPRPRRHSRPAGGA